MKTDNIKMGFYTLADIKVNTILCGKHGWGANAIEAGTDWTNKPRYRVAGVTNQFFVLEDSYLGGKEEIVYIDSLEKKMDFASNYKIVKLEGDIDDFVFNSKCSVYNVLDGVGGTWASRKGCSFTYKSTYEIKFNYKNYGFILFRRPKLEKELEEKLNLQPVKTEKIKNSFGGGYTEFTWYFTWNQTYSNKTPWQAPEKIQKRALKFMWFVWNYFKDGYAGKIKSRQMKEPIILVAK